MGFKPEFKKKILASSISSACLFLTMGAVAQDQAGIEEEVIVTGVKASQASAINTKRDAVSVVDGISAEDIGKLPDVTISDSLQRIPGIQVERTAGEGGPVQIRGLANVATMLNGEVFLSATTIDSSSADFGDLPSQLFAGAEVYKSPVATLPSLGITGTVDLQTRRPFDLDEGFTFSGGVEVDQGSISEETDPTVNGLISWQNEKIGMLASFVRTEKTLASDYNGFFDTSENGGIGAANNNHGWGATPSVEVWGDTVDPNIYHITPQGFSAFHKEEERERDGVNLSFQADLGEGFQLTADYFYSRQERWNRRAGVSHNNRWQTFADYTRPVTWGGNSFTLTPVSVEDGSVNRTENWRTVTAWEARPHRLQSFSQANVNKEISQNSNIELNYDNGGSLTGQVRATRASANASMRHGYTEGDLISIDGDTLVSGPGGFVAAEHCGPDDTRVGIGDKDGVKNEAGEYTSEGEPGCYAAFSPGGIVDSDFMIGYNVYGEHPQFTGFDQRVNGGQGEMTVAEYMASKDSYHIGAFSSEGNTDDRADMTTVSTNWNFKFEETPFISSIDFGLRKSKREVEHRQFSYFNEIGENRCAAQWKAVDQFTGPDEQCQEGEWIANPLAGTLIENPNYGVLAEDGETIIPTQLRYANGELIFDEAGAPVYGPTHIMAPDVILHGYTMLPPTGIEEHGNAIWVDDFGGVSGLPGVWVVDPKNFDDTFAFQEKVFGAGTTKKVMDPGQAYDVTLSELSYFLQGNFEVGPVSGNLGMKIVETELNIRQNEVGASIPHSGASVDTGDVVSKREYIDYLPSLNLNYSITDDLVARFAYGKTMQPLDLIQWGGGKTVGKVFQEDCQCMRVIEGEFNGNAELNPTRASNYDLSFEYYLGDASMFNIGYFKVEIDSFVQAGTVQVDEPDEDGIRRGPFTFDAPVQGTGGEVEGVEIGAKIAFSDFFDAPVISDMGLDVNYTYSDSSQDAIGEFNDVPTGVEDETRSVRHRILVDGRQKELPFPNNSENTYNFVAWYENDLVSARLAYNFRSERMITQGNRDTGYQGLYQDDYGQLDLNVTVNVTDEVSVYLNGANITEEYQQAYLETKEQKAFQNIYEARWALGARFTF